MEVQSMHAQKHNDLLMFMYLMKTRLIIIIELRNVQKLILFDTHVEFEELQKHKYTIVKI